MTVAAEDRVTSAQILHFLKSRYSAPQWASFTEVEISGRRIDFVAVGLWQHTRNVGYRSIGVEVKTSRGDFVREVEDPSKRAPAEAQMHECYFATPRGLVKVDEVPEGWGLLEVGGSQLRRAKVAMQRTPTARWDLVSQIARKSAYPEGNRAAGAAAEPLRAWKYAGRELTEDELMALAEEKWAASLATKLQRAINEGAAGERGRFQLQRDQLAAFFDIAGVNAWDRAHWPPNRIRDEFKAGAGALPSPKRKLLEEALKSAEGHLLHIRRLLGTDEDT